MKKILGNFVALLAVIAVYFYICDYAAGIISKPNYGIALVLIIWAVITILTVVITWEFSQNLWNAIKEKFKL
jgi:predicted membrane protein